LLDNNKKRKIRSLLANLSPDLKGEMLAKNLEEDVKVVSDKLASVKDFSGSIEEIKLAIFNFRDIVVNKLASLPKKEELDAIKQAYLDSLNEVEQKFAVITGNLKGDILGLNSEIAGDKEETHKDIEELKKDFEKWRLETLTKFSNLGGGSQNRKIQVSSVNMSNKYTDINLLGATAADNNTTKQVDITLPAPTSGGSFTGGVPSSVIFVGGTPTVPTLTQNPQFFQYNQYAGSLQVTTTLGGELVGGTWTVNSGWTGSTTLGPWVHGSNGTATVTKSIASTIGELYIVSFTISALTVGSVSITWAGQTLQNPYTGTALFDANLDYVVKVKATVAGTNFVITPTNTARLTITKPSARLLSGGIIRTGYLDLWQSSSASVGSGRIATFANASTTTNLDFDFSGVTKSAISVASTGAISFYHGAASGIGQNWFAGSSVTSPSLFSQNIPATFLHNGDGRFGGKVNAGSTSAATSTLQSQGSTALKVVRLTTDTVLTASSLGTLYLLDGSENATCSGSASVACSTYTNQTDCQARTSHGGCSWNNGSDCTVLDEAGCLGEGECTTNYFDCSAYNGDETGCNDNSGSGCSWNDPDCTGGDFTGCTGRYGTSCSGTPNCANILTGCASETGCSAVFGINVTLPQIPTVTDRNYWFTNDSSSSAVAVIYPYAGDTVDRGNSTITLSTFKQGVHIANYTYTGDCSLLDEETCGMTSGCSQNYGTCDGLGETQCNADANCSWNGDSCDGGEYYSGCSGSYLLGYDWPIFA
jgi:hypothetical protein